MEKASFREWLLNTLVDEGIIEEDDFDTLETKSDILETTEVESFDIDSYYDEFCSHCTTTGKEPVNDLDE